MLSCAIRRGRVGNNSTRAGVCPPFIAAPQDGSSVWLRVLGRLLEQEITADLLTTPPVPFRRGYYSKKWHQGIRGRIRFLGGLSGNKFLNFGCVAL